MTEMLQIRSAESYFEEYGRDGIGKGADKWMIKRQLVDAFHKEIFGLVAMRAKKTFNYIIPPEGDPEAIRIAKNVIHDTQKKWEKLCWMFAQYKETRDLLEFDDLKLDESDIMRGVMMQNGLGTEDILRKEEKDVQMVRDSLENGVEIADEDDGF